MKINYQIELEKVIEQIKKEERVPKLLLHSCCAPCSSYVLEYLSEFFEITIYYFNPNITEKEEYLKRIEEQKRLIAELNPKNPIHFLEGAYNPEKFFEIALGLEEEPEGGARCIKCYYQRLEETARMAKDGNFDYFTTTLTVSPYKKSEKLNDIGTYLEKQYHITYLHSDFKKKNGYKRSIELSKVYGLYRQDYCGCIYSKKEAEKRKEQLENI